MEVIVLGCKDYPAFKHARDVGGIEVFCNEVLPRLNSINFSVLTRRYKNAAKTEQSSNIDIYRLPFINLPLFKTHTFNLAAFFKALSMKADIIWAHEPVAGFYAYWLSKIKGIPYILHIHSNGSKEPAGLIRRYGLKLMEFFAYRNAKEVIFVSSRISEELKQPGITIPIGVNQARFKSSRQDASLASIPGKKLCFIGRLIKVKGIHYLLHAFSKLNQPASLIIVGEGDEKEMLMHLAKDLNIDEKVFFLGYKPSSSIMPYIDVFILPSLSEGLPHTILEAIACKKPVVASNVGDIKKLVTHYLVQPGNIDELAAMIKKALEEKKLEKLPDEYILDNTLSSIKKIIN